MKTPWKPHVNAVPWQNPALGAPTNRFPLVWEKSSNGKWLKTAFEKNAHLPVFRAEMLVTQYVLSSSHHLVTPLIYIHFCVWLELFDDRWWLKEVWCAPDFLSNCSICVPVAAPGITGSLSPSKICRGTFSQKNRNWSIWQAAHGYVASEGPSTRHVHIRPALKSALKIALSLNFQFEQNWA